MGTGRLKVGLAGVGHLGKAHARILSQLPGVELVGVADPMIDQARAVADERHCKAFDSHKPLLELVEAMVVVTPTRFHHAVASEALERGLPVFVEKPLASTSAEALRLEEAARSRGVPLQVGHIERFNPAYEALRRRLFRPRYIRAERSGPFTGRSLDIGAVLDLMIHDIDLVLDQARGAEVVRVEAMGTSILGGHEDLAQARLVMGDGLVADLTACRCQPTPVRQMTMWGAEGFATLDFATKCLRFVEPSEEIVQKRIKAPEMAAGELASLRETIFQKHLVPGETACPGPHDALTSELIDFVAAIRQQRAPRVDGRAGRRAILVAERIIAAIAEHAWTGNPDGPRGPHGLPALSKEAPRRAA
ncbi:MAG: Gfo/Idh/MocA family protein [Planctomycetota bacterium]